MNIRRNRKNEGKTRETRTNRSLGALIVALVLFFSGLSLGCTDREELVLYASTDDIYAREIVAAFEKDTGLSVSLVPDSEASKGVGFMRRLQEEKKSPVADVYWNNEISRTLILKKNGVTVPFESPSAKSIPSFLKDENNHWAAFSARARVIVYNTEKLKKEDAPKSILDLTDPKWKDQAVFANPKAGTTASHVSAIYLQLGDEKAEKYFNDLKNNGARMVGSNSQVRDVVARGEAMVGLTDTDDVWVGIDSGKTIDMIYPDQDSFGTLVIPNSVIMIKGCPHPELAKKFIDFLLSEKTEEMLAAGKARQIPVRKGVKVPEGVKTLGEIKAMELSFEKISEKMNQASDAVRKLFEK